MVMELSACPGKIKAAMTSSRHLRLTFRIPRHIRHRDLYQVARFNVEMVRRSGAEQGSVIPGQFRYGIRKLLEPAVVGVAAVVHRITADKNDFGRFRCWRSRRSPKFLRQTTGSGGVQCRSAIFRRSGCTKTVVQKFIPRRLRISGHAGRAKCFLHQLRTFHFRSADQHVEDIDFREAAEQRHDHRLNGEITAIGCQRVAPTLEVMRQRNVPMTQGRGGVFVITKPHHFRNLLLQVDPIEPLFCLPDLRPALAMRCKQDRRRR